MINKFSYNNLKIINILKLMPKFYISRVCCHLDIHLSKQRIRFKLDADWFINDVV